MGSGVGRQPGTTGRCNHSQSRQRQNHHTGNEHIDGNELHLGNADLVTEIRGRATYHKGANEDGEQRDKNHADETRTQATVRYFPEQHVEECNSAAERRKTVGCCRGGAGGAVRSGNDRERGTTGTESHFLALRVAGPSGVTRGESEPVSYT